MFWPTDRGGDASKGSLAFMKYILKSKSFYTALIFLLSLFWQYGLVPTLGVAALPEELFALLAASGLLFGGDVAVRVLGGDLVLNRKTGE